MGNFESTEIVFKKDPEKDGVKNRGSLMANLACRIREDSDSMHRLAVLKECLDKVGIEMTAVRYEDEKTDVLSFKIDFETFSKVTQRGAGRKKDYSMSERYKKCTVSELKTKLESMKKCEIIEELGCPKATFYRILKNIAAAEVKNLVNGNDSIWYYTS